MNKLSPDRATGSMKKRKNTITLLTEELRSYDAAEKAQNSATISIIIALFTIVPAICYLLSAIIAKRYYSLTTHNLKTVMEQLAQGKRRCQQQFTSQEVQN